MKKLATLIAALMLLVSGAAFAQNSTPAKPLKKETRKAAKTEEVRQMSAAPEAAPLKKDGTPDKRYKASRKLKKDGTPDKRYKENKAAAPAAN